LLPLLNADHDPLNTDRHFDSAFQPIHACSTVLIGLFPSVTFFPQSGAKRAAAFETWAAAHGKEYATEKERATRAEVCGCVCVSLFLCEFLCVSFISFLCDPCFVRSISLFCL
jgi:hypothetical protein